MTVRGIGKKIEYIGVPLLITCIALKIFIPGTFEYSTGSIIPLVIAGAVLLVTGVFLHLYSAFRMLKAFKEKRLLTSGPFAFCRNPMYSTLFFMIIPGLSFIINTWLLLPIIPVLLIVFYININEEEDYLQNEFREDYSAYKKRATRLIPKLF